MLFKYETHVIQIKYYIITILILEVQFYKHITKVDKVYIIRLNEVHANYKP